LSYQQGVSQQDEFLSRTLSMTLDTLSSDQQTLATLSSLFFPFLANGENQYQISPFRQINSAYF
jgi:hypothetical protein